MSHPPLKIFGYSEAAMFLRDKSRPRVDAIVSIHGAREFGVEATVRHRLDLLFDDVEAPIPGDAMSMQRVLARKRFAEQNGLIEIAPTIEDAAAIIAFAERVHDVEGMVLCHCAGGMSRASAAALICLAVWHGPGNEVEHLKGIRALRRGAMPHVGLIRFADELLNRQRQLVNAIKSIDR